MRAKSGPATSASRPFTVDVPTIKADEFLIKVPASAYTIQRKGKITRDSPSTSPSNAPRHSRIQLPAQFPLSMSSISPWKNVHVLSAKRRRFRLLVRTAS
ncbi:hypothetical protein LINPERPRIM_LOCUS17549 [Linum perenne]